MNINFAENFDEVSGNTLSKEALLEKELITYNICNGKNCLNRLNVLFDNYKGKSFKDMTKPEFDIAIEGLMESLASTLLPPDGIYIPDSQEESLSADWYPPYPLVFNTFEDYLVLIKNFENYIATFDFAVAIHNNGQFADTQDVPEDKCLVYSRLFGLYTKSVVSDYNPQTFQGFELDNDNVEVRISKIKSNCEYIKL